MKELNNEINKESGNISKGQDPRQNLKEIFGITNKKDVENKESLKEQKKSNDCSEEDICCGCFPFRKKPKTNKNEKPESNKNDSNNNTGGGCAVGCAGGCSNGCSGCGGGCG